MIQNQILLIILHTLFEPYIKSKLKKLDRWVKKVQIILVLEYRKTDDHNLMHKKRQSTTK